MLPEIEVFKAVNTRLAVLEHFWLLTLIPVLRRGSQCKYILQIGAILRIVIFSGGAHCSKSGGQNVDRLMGLICANIATGRFYRKDSLTLERWWSTFVLKVETFLF